MGKVKSRETECGHTDRKHYANGYCQPCYSGVWMKANKAEWMQGQGKDQLADAVLAYALERPEKVAPIFKRTQFAENGCWEWTGAKLNSGYGVFTISVHLDDGKRYFQSTLMPHRVMFAAFNKHLGDLPKAEQGNPADGIVIDHKCNNRVCVNPNHRHLVTQAENMNLMAARNAA